MLESLNERLDMVVPSVDVGLPSANHAFRGGKCILQTLCNVRHCVARHIA
jgi:hypothetical protein